MVSIFEIDRKSFTAGGRYFDKLAQIAAHHFQVGNHLVTGLRAQVLEIGAFRVTIRSVIKLQNKRRCYETEFPSCGRHPTHH